MTYYLPIALHLGLLFACSFTLIWSLRSKSSPFLQAVAKTTAIKRWRDSLNYAAGANAMAFFQVLTFKEPALFLSALGVILAYGPAKGFLVITTAKPANGVRG